MYAFIIALIIIASILLIGVVLIQKSKGGGLASGFASGNQMMGVRKTTDFLEKSTWTLAIVLVVLCLASSLSIPKNGIGTGTQVDTEMRQQIENTMAPSEYTMPATQAE